MICAAYTLHSIALVFPDLALSLICMTSEPGLFALAWEDRGGFLPGEILGCIWSEE